MRRYHRALWVIKKLGLPSKLLWLITNDLLHTEIERANAELDVMNAWWDQWEIDNPQAAALAPWAASRQAWKDAGRPRAPWYEVIQWSVPTNVAFIRETDIDAKLYVFNQIAAQRKRMARQRVERERARLRGDEVAQSTRRRSSSVQALKR